MTDFYSQNRCVCSMRSHGPLLCAFCLSFHFKFCSFVEKVAGCWLVIFVINRHCSESDKPILSNYHLHNNNSVH